jgi:hypothetical protein
MSIKILVEISAEKEFCSNDGYDCQFLHFNKDNEAYCSEFHKDMETPTRIGRLVKRLEECHKAERE